MFMIWLELEIRVNHYQVSISIEEKQKWKKKNCSVYILKKRLLEMVFSFIHCFYFALEKQKAVVSPA